MGKEYAARREDADYALWRSEGSSTWVIEDKRTGHRHYFNACQPKGFQGNVFLYHYPSRVDDPSPSIGFKSAHLDKDSLPEWLIEEFEHIREHNEMTPATDPRGEEDG
jgi:hypothetical protein